MRNLIFNNEQNQSVENNEGGMGSLTMMKMRMIISTMMMMMMMVMMMMMMAMAMGNQVVGKWVQSSWQMGVLASLNVQKQMCNCATHTASAL